MSHIPPISPLYFSAEDHELGRDPSVISESDSFYARTMFFERCAITMQKFLETAELSDEKRQLYEGVRDTLQYEDAMIPEFAQENVGTVAQAVFEQHLLEHDVSADDFCAAAAYLESVMNAQNGGISTLFETILQAHAEKEYTAGVFFMVSDMIDIVNAQKALHTMN